EQRFTGITPGSDYDVWLPLSDAQRITDARFWRNRQGDVTNWWLALVARLKTETPLAQAQAAVSGLFRNEMLYGAIPVFNRGEMETTPAQRGGAPARGGAVRRQRVLGGTGAPPRGNSPALTPA